MYSRTSVMTVLILLVAVVAAAFYLTLLLVLGRMLETVKRQKEYDSRWVDIQARLKSEDMATRRAAAREALRLNREGPHKKRRLDGSRRLQ